MEQDKHQRVPVKKKKKKKQTNRNVDEFGQIMLNAALTNEEKGTQILR